MKSNHIGILIVFKNFKNLMHKMLSSFVTIMVEIVFL